MRYHFTLTRIAINKKTGSKSVGEDMEKVEPSYMACGNVKWCSLFGIQFDINTKTLIVDM